MLKASTAGPQGEEPTFFVGLSDMAEVAPCPTLLQATRKYQLTLGAVKDLSVPGHLDGFEL